MRTAGISTGILEGAVAQSVAKQLVTSISGGGGAGQRAPHWPDVRVGVDLVALADIAGSLERFGHRYLRRVFTPHEISWCTLGPWQPGRPVAERRSPADTDRAPGGAAALAGYSCQGLAARFAAKEAALKVLRPSGWRPEWPSIEVHRAAEGWCTMRLGGRARWLAEQAGIDELAVSLTHMDAVAGAVVVGVCGNPHVDRQDDLSPTTGEKGMD